MTKITPEHLARTGIVYVRQSSPHQVANNLESQRRQYALVARGQQLGRSDVQVIDDDLGRSGNGISQEQILLPVVVHKAGKRSIDWKTPVYHTIHHILTNPVYCGAYAFGRRGASVTIENGRKRTCRCARRNWKDRDVLIKGHHEEYISWEEFQRNQRLIADNANRRSNMGRGSIRRGEALLAGLFRCARCGRKLKVSYSTKGGPAQRYVCGAFSDRVESRCLSFAGIRIDRTVAQEVLDRLQPLGIEAAMAAMKDHEQEHLEKRRQLENALEHARFEAARAHRQYDQVDPDNRLVASELERRWNEKLANVHALEEQLAQHDTGRAFALNAKDRDRLLALGSDLSRAWDEAGASIETRKKIVRLLIAEIIADVVGDKLELVIHWHGGDRTRLSAKRNRVGQNQWASDADVVDLVRILSRQMSDDSIAAVLNRSGKSTGRGNRWTRSRVCSLRYNNEIALYRDGERADRGEVTIEEASVVLAISTSTVRRMINDGILPAKQLCKGAPWIIHACDLERKEVRAEARARRLRCPSSGDPRQERLDF